MWWFQVFEHILFYFFQSFNHLHVEQSISDDTQHSHTLTHLHTEHRPSIFLPFGYIFLSSHLHTLNNNIINIFLHKKEVTWVSFEEEEDV